MSKTNNFKTVAKMWGDEKRHYVKNSTFAAYSLLITNHLLPAFGTRRNITEELVQNFVLEKLNSGLSQKSVKDILIVLKMILKYGRKHKLLKFNDMDIHFPTEEHTKEVKTMTKDNQRNIMKYTRTHPTLKNIGIYICLSAGLRIGEICALTWNDIDIETGIIYIRKTIQRIYIKDDNIGYTKLIISTPKSKNSLREVPMTNQLKRILTPLKHNMSANDYVLTGCPIPTEPRTYRTYYNKLTNKIGLPHIKFHGLRHSFATRCVESSCDYKTLSTLLGHANVSTTLNLYVHPDLDQKKKCVEQMFKTLITR